MRDLIVCGAIIGLFLLAFAWYVKTDCGIYPLTRRGALRRGQRLARQVADEAIHQAYNDLEQAARNIRDNREWSKVHNDRWSRLWKPDE